jgi:hypothetical protein
LDSRLRELGFESAEAEGVVDVALWPLKVGLRLVRLVILSDLVVRDRKIEVLIHPAR